MSVTKSSFWKKPLYLQLCNFIILKFNTNVVHVCDSNRNRKLKSYWFSSSAIFRTSDSECELNLPTITDTQKWTEKLFLPMKYLHRRDSQEKLTKDWIPGWNSGFLYFRQLWISITIHLQQLQPIIRQISNAISRGILKITLGVHMRRGELKTNDQPAG